MFWHELVLNGIGGRTVLEAKARMTYPEFVNWCEYRNRQGGLNAGLRVDRAIARALAAHFNSVSKDKKFKMSDFSPYDSESHKVDVDDPSQVFGVLKGLAHGKKPRDTDG